MATTALALAALISSTPVPATLPNLTGEYVYTSIFSCESNVTQQTSGTIKFDSSTKKAFISGFESTYNDGTPVLTPVSQKLDFSSTDTTLTIGTTTYETFATKNVISLIGVVTISSLSFCPTGIFQATLSR